MQKVYDGYFMFYNLVRFLYNVGNRLYLDVYRVLQGSFIRFCKRVKVIIQYVFCYYRGGKYYVFILS